MNNLKNLRKKKGYSIKKLHDLTGIPVRTLEDWDAEKRQIQSYHRIKRLSGILECDMDELMTKEENCLYGEDRASVCLVQEEEGVYVTVIIDDMLEPAAFAIMPREEALNLLKHLKNDLQIKDIILPYIKQNG